MDEQETPSATDKYAVHTTKLCRVFGSLRAVEELDLRVEPGTLYGFLGRNGAGKSTTIKMLTGILAPSSGSISLLGVNPSNEAQAAEVRRRIGVVPEDLALFELLTGREYLDFVGTIYLLEEAAARERVDELFEVLNVGADEKQLVLEYSHGMRKKLALAAALIMVFCLVLFMIGNHFSITGPWAASFMSLKQRGEAVASNLGALLGTALVVGVIMLATAGVLALERLVADAGWAIPLYLISSILELGIAAVWYRDAVLHQAKTMPAQEERILEAINTPVD